MGTIKFSFSACLRSSQNSYRSELNGEEKLITLCWFVLSSLLQEVFSLAGCVWVCVIASMINFPLSSQAAHFSFCKMQTSIPAFAEREKLMNFLLMLILHHLFSPAPTRHCHQEETCEIRRCLFSAMEFMFLFRATRVMIAETRTFF